MPDFDIIVLGGGSAGCIATSWLCQKTDHTVCLVEAGPDYGPVNSGRWPPELLDPRSSPRTHDWGYKQTRAKVIGGCSSHNPCAAIWGSPEDYNRWAQAGNLGWSYAEIKPLIDSIEKATSQHATPYRGTEGSLPTQPFRDDELASWQRFFLESAIAAGFPRTVDLSAPIPEEGVAPYHANIENSLRWNASFAFIDPVRDRPNLTIMSDTLADRLVIEQDRAIEIVCHSQHGVFELKSKWFVLCAGTYGSPMILMRSGIGPEEHLAELRIPEQIHLPGVGRNLHDHYGIEIRFEPSRSALHALEEDIATGKFYPSQVIMKARSTHCRSGFDLHILPYQPLEEQGERVFTILANNMTPLSRGRVMLNGTDPYLPPRIDFRFFTDPEDRDIAIVRDGLLLVHRLAQTEPLASATKPETKSVSEKSETDSYIRSNVGAYSHPVGTCKMGSRSHPDAVVNAAGHVHGSTNIFVADASIMPQIPRANTNLTCMLIGLRIADLLIRREKS